jgi:hypothetical protein
MSIIPDGSKPADVARTTKALGLPGYRPGRVIRELRAVRAARRPQEPTTIHERIARRVLDRYGAVIRRRGGETQVGTASLEIWDRRDGFVVLGVDGWRRYPAPHPARRVHLRYLAGEDDNGSWAVRLPGTVSTVPDALEWVTPAEVTRARNAGRHVVRQGDVYGIEVTRKGYETPTGWIGDDLRVVDGANVTSHHWDAETRLLTHHPEDGRAHWPLVIPWPVQFVQQSTYGMGQGWGRGPAD